MFAEEATWIGSTLRSLRLRQGGLALDVGSSTGLYRDEVQPHIVRELIEPLHAAGVEILHVDIKAETGVDIVADICAGEPAPHDIGRPLDLVLCNNTLVHVTDVDAAIRTLRRLPARGGHLLVTTPEVYRKVRDPLDNGFRPSPAELAERLRDDELEVVASHSVRIDDPLNYRRWLGRPARHLIAGRWLPVPGGVEQVRLRSKRLRWRVSCALLKRISEPDDRL